MKLEGARVVVQGFGAVGRHAARFLAHKGARLVAASDSKGTVADPGGLDVLELKTSTALARGHRTQLCTHCGRFVACSVRRQQ